jgi:hypothetical protein
MTRVKLEHGGSYFLANFADSQLGSELPSPRGATQRDSSTMPGSGQALRERSMA